MRRQLAQSRPADTSAASILSGERPWEVDLILVTNTTANDTTFSIYHDANGTTYDEDTAIFFQAPLRAKDVAYVAVSIANADRTGNLAIQSGEADGLNFTVYGELKGEQL